MKDVFWITAGESGRYVYVSPSFEQIWGFPRAAVYESPQSWLDAVHPEDRSRVLRAMRARRWRGRYDETYRIQSPDGSTRWIHDRAVPVCDATGAIGQIIGTAEDVTESERRDEMFMRVQRLESAGTLAASLVHDVNNVLSVVQGFGLLLTADRQLPPDMTEAAEQVVLAAQRAADIARQLLSFSRERSLKMRPIDLNDVVRDMASALERVAGDDVDVDIALDSGPLPANVDRGALEQMLLNLVTNARDAMPNGGRVRVETGRTLVSSGASESDPGSRPGEYVFMRVADCGAGIDVESLKRIYEPFYTTKPAGHGSGLGLFAVARAVKQHAGCIRLDTQLGHGSSFEICLPALPGRPVLQVEQDHFDKSA